MQETKIKKQDERLKRVFRIEKRFAHSLIELWHDNIMQENRKIKALVGDVSLFLDNLEEIMPERMLKKESRVGVVSKLERLMIKHILNSFSKKWYNFIDRLRTKYIDDFILQLGLNTTNTLQTLLTDFFFQIGQETEKEKLLERKWLEGRLAEATEKLDLYRVDKDRITKYINSSAWGGTIESRLKNIKKETGDKIKKTLEKGMREGKGYKEIVEEAKKQIAMKASRIEKIIRTEGQRVQNNILMKTYWENRKLLDGVEYLATLDLRTCEVCGAYDREYFAFEPINPKVKSVSDAPYIPQHPLCRCVYVPVTRFYGASDKRASMFGTRGGNYGDFLRDLNKKNPEKVKEILGKSYEKWEKKKFRITPKVLKLTPQSTYEKFLGKNKPKPKMEDVLNQFKKKYPKISVEIESGIADETVIKSLKSLEDIPEELKKEYKLNIRFTKKLKGDEWVDDINDLKSECLAGFLEDTKIDILNIREEVDYSSIREFGHHLHFVLLDQEELPEELIKFYQHFYKFSKSAMAPVEDLEEKAGRYLYHIFNFEQKEGAVFPTEYAEMNVLETFSETFYLYIKNPEFLKDKIGEEVFGYFEKVINKLKKGSKAFKRPPVKELPSKKAFEKLRDKMIKWRKEYSKLKDKEEEFEGLFPVGFTDPLDFRISKEFKKIKPEIDALKGWIKGEDIYQKIKEYDRLGQTDQELLRRFNKIFNEMPEYKGKIFRHIRKSSALSGQLDKIKAIENLNAGDEYVFDSYVSFRPKDAYGLGVEDNDIVFFVKNSRGGKEITALTGNKEGEVILPKGKYRVVGNKITTLGDINPEFPWKSTAYKKYKEKKIRAIELEKIEKIGKETEKEKKAHVFKTLRNKMIDWRKKFNQKNKHERTDGIFPTDLIDPLSFNIPEEYDAIKPEIKTLKGWVYGGDIYKKIKEYDRLGQTDQEVLKRFNKIFNEMPVYKGKIFRHIRKSSALSGQLDKIKAIENLKPGDTYVFDSYTSFRPKDTYGLGVLRNDIIFYTKSEDGREITALTGNSEGEVILPKGKYRVKQNFLTTLGDINPEFPDYPESSRYFHDYKNTFVRAIELEKIK